VSKTKVGVIGFGTIGSRLADGVAVQGDMELVGVADVAPALPVKAMQEAGGEHKVFYVDADKKDAFAAAGVPLAGSLDDLLGEIDVALDATPGGVGAKMKDLYRKHNVKAIFQGGEKDDIADVFFHGYANYENGVGKDFLKLTSCNTTGLIRAVDALDRAVGMEKVAITIIRRVADPGDTHRGLVDVLQVEKVPNHQCVDLMKIMPHVHATGLLVHTPVTHGHIINLVATPKKSISVAETIDVLRQHPRIKVVKISDGYNSNAAFFQYQRHLGAKRADQYEIGVWEECIGLSGKDVMFAIYIPQEAVTIPETVDGIRACVPMQTDRLEAVGLTNKYLGLKARV